MTWLARGSDIRGPMLSFWALGTPGDGLLVMLLGQRGTDQAEHRGAVRNHTDDVGIPL